MSALTVIIPTRDRTEKLRLTLDALRRQTEPDFETIVVLDGVDQQVPVLPGVRVLEQEHAGPGVARNRGAAAATGELILFLGDDMVPTPQLVAHHLRHQRDEPSDNVAVLGRATWHPGVPRSRLHRWLEWSGALFDFPASEAADPDAGWARFYSCNVSMKRSFFEASGGFDPAFTFDYEDLDLAWRLAERGLRLIYEPRALAHHFHAYDWSAVVRRYESRAAAEQVMMSKHVWFAPWFRSRIEAADRAPSTSSLWTIAADLVPARPDRLRRGVRRRADRYYLRQLAPAFLTAWNAQRPEVHASARGVNPGGS